MKTIVHPITKKNVVLVGSPDSNTRLMAALELAEQLRESGCQQEEIQTFVDDFLEKQAYEREPFR